MSLDTKESRQVLKLLRLALDNRGSDKQADMAAAKALAICRARGVTPESLGELLNPVGVQSVPMDAQPWDDVKSRFGVILSENLFAEVDSLLESLRPKRRARA